MDKYVKGELLGSGTFGEVFQATVKADNSIVAIKKIRMGLASEGVNFSALREIKLLRELHNEYIVELFDVFQHNSNIHLVFEFMNVDLEILIRDKEIIFKPEDIKSYMLMLLKGVQYIHQNWVLHRDLKPNNLLISSKGVLKIGDFGLARTYASPNRVLSKQAQTRWYRAPELLFGATLYSSSIDIWSVGAIFAEIMLRRPYFSGQSDIDQLSKIFAALGTPTKQNWPGVTELPNYIEFSETEGTPLRLLFGGASNQALDLLSQFLKFDPNERISGSDALNHPYFTQELPKPTDPKDLNIIPSKNNEKKVKENPNTENLDEDDEPLKKKRKFTIEPDCSAKKKLFDDT